MDFMMKIYRKPEVSKVILYIDIWTEPKQQNINLETMMPMKVL